MRAMRLWRTGARRGVRRGLTLPSMVVALAVAALMAGLAAAGGRYLWLDWQGRRFVAELDVVVATAQSLYDARRGYVGVDNGTICRVLGGRAASGWCQRSAAGALLLLPGARPYRSASGNRMIWAACAGALQFGDISGVMGVRSDLDPAVHGLPRSVSNPRYRLDSPCDDYFAGTARTSPDLLGVLPVRKVGSPKSLLGYGPGGGVDLSRSTAGDGVIGTGLPRGHPARDRLAITLVAVPERLCRRLLGRRLPTGWRGLAAGGAFRGGVVGQVATSSAGSFSHYFGNVGTHGFFAGATTVLSGLKYDDSLTGYRLEDADFLTESRLHVYARSVRRPRRYLPPRFISSAGAEYEFDFEGLAVLPVSELSSSVCGTVVRRYGDESPVQREWDYAVTIYLDPPTF